jgi:hypothetical protein
MSGLRAHRSHRSRSRIRLGGSSGCLSRLERPGPKVSHWSHGRHGCRRSGTLGAMGEPPPGRIESQPAIRRRVHHVASGTERRFPNGNGPGQLLTCDEDGGWPSGLFPLRQTFAHERHRLPLLWQACTRAIAGAVQDNQRVDRDFAKRDSHTGVRSYIQKRSPWRQEEERALS